MRAQGFKSVTLTAIAVLICLGANAQEKPDLSGTWKAVKYDDERLRFAQDADSLTITRMIGTEREPHYWEARLTYAFDGSETLNQVTLPDGRTWIERSTARWVAAAFEVTTTIISDRGTNESLWIYYLDNTRKLVRVEIGTDIRGADLTAMVPIEFERVPP
jgi:hypothetical protein